MLKTQLNKPLLTGSDNRNEKIFINLTSLDNSTLKKRNGSMEHTNDIHDTPMTPTTPTTPHTPITSKNSLIMPDCVKSIGYNDELNTISLSRDIFTTIIILKAFRIWSEIQSKHRNQLIILCLLCIILQLGLLTTLFLEMTMSPPWDDYDEETKDDGKRLLVLLTKFWCLMVVLLYLFKELYLFKAYLQLRKQLRDFRETLTKCFTKLYYLYNILLWLLAMILSIGLITTSRNGFDAVLNAVAILFVLDIDNWLYSMIKSHYYINDELYDIKYQNHKDFTTYTKAQYKYLSAAFCCKSRYKSKADGSENFISLVTLFGWFGLVCSIALICIGIYYAGSFLLLRWIGGIMLCVVLFYYIWFHLFSKCVSCRFHCKNKAQIAQFIDIDLPTIIHKYVKKIDLKQSTNSNRKIKINEDIMNEFIAEAYKYFDDNNCGVHDTNKVIKEKLIMAFGEYFKNCDENNIQNVDVDYGAVNLGLKFTI